MDPASRESPRVSVIIPTFNRERYLAAAIDSVLRQTMADLELIVVDDGSTDSTATLVGAIQDHRLNYIIQSHRGLSASLNRGLQAARGEFIARLDSDDLFVPDALATMTATAEAAPAVDVVWACGRIMDRDGNDQPRTRGSREHFPGEMLRSLVYEDCTSGAGMLIRRACFAQVGVYDEGPGYSEDWDMAIRLARQFRFRFVDRIVFRVREHDDSMTGRYSPERARFLATRTAPLDKLFRQPDLPAEILAIRPVAYANVHIFCGRMWLSSRRFGPAMREFARAAIVSRTPLRTALAIAWRAGAVSLLERSAAGRRALAALNHRV